MLVCEIKLDISKIFFFLYKMEKYYAEHLNRWKSAYVQEYEITRGHNKFPREGNKLKHKMSVWHYIYGYMMTQFFFWCLMFDKRREFFLFTINENFVLALSLLKIFLILVVMINTQTN